MSAPDPAPFLDWRDRRHWAFTPAPCRYCARLTNLRDNTRQPSHKTCAETAAADAATIENGAAA